jgi:hypothetical protein
MHVVVLFCQKDITKRAKKFLTLEVVRKDENAPYFIKNIEVLLDNLKVQKFGAR